MHNCQFSREAVCTIQRQRYHHPDPIVRKRMTILWHKHHGLPHHRIAELSGAAPNTVTATIRTYLEKGLAGVEERKFYRPASKLDPYRAQLIAYFLEHPPRTLKEAAVEIERLTTMSFTITHVRNFLLSIGLSRKKLEASPENSMTTSEKSKKPLLTVLWSQSWRMPSTAASTSISLMQPILYSSHFSASFGVFSDSSSIRPRGGSDSMSLVH